MRSVPRGHQKNLREQGFGAMLRFALFGDARKDVRGALGCAPLELDFASAGVPPEEKIKRRSAQARIIDAW
eukprot:5767672-Lingulodinium_polyedra.AAC.1